MAKKPVEDFSEEKIEAQKTVVSYPMSWDRYLEVYQPDFDKYQKAYIGAPFLGALKTKEEWDSIVDKNLSK